MPKFIRNYIAGGTYFFTLVTSDRTKFFTDERYIESFLSALSTIQEYHHFDLIAYCVLPDHIHLILTLAEDDKDFSSRIKEIKKMTTKESREFSGDRNLIIWQKRFWEHTIRDQEDFQNCFDYIHYNPIKHGYSDTYDWLWSSYWSYYCEGENNAPEIDPKKFQNSMDSFGE